MSQQLACPHCRMVVHVFETLAAERRLCPSCQSEMAARRGTRGDSGRGGRPSAYGGRGTWCRRRAATADRLRAARSTAEMEDTAGRAGVEDGIAWLGTSTLGFHRRAAATGWDIATLANNSARSAASRACRADRLLSDVWRNGGGRCSPRVRPTLLLPRATENGCAPRHGRALASARLSSRGWRC